LLSFRNLGFGLFRDYRLGHLGGILPEGNYAAAR
jgi:hypothetical protein